MLRNHGADLRGAAPRGPRPYLLPDFNLLGFNYRMTDLQGAVGLVQLAKLDRFIAERERWAAGTCRSCVAAVAAHAAAAGRRPTRGRRS